jgi:hypothetical protein
MCQFETLSPLATPPVPAVCLETVNQRLNATAPVVSAWGIGPSLAFVSIFPCSPPPPDRRRRGPRLYHRVSTSLSTWSSPKWVSVSSRHFPASPLALWRAAAVRELRIAVSIDPRPPVAPPISSPRLCAPGIRPLEISQPWFFAVLESRRLPACLAAPSRWWVADVLHCSADLHYHLFRAIYMNDPPFRVYHMCLIVTARTMAWT